MSSRMTGLRAWCSPSPRSMPGRGRRRGSSPISRAGACSPPIAARRPRSSTSTAARHPEVTSTNLSAAAHTLKTLDRFVFSPGAPARQSASPPAGGAAHASLAPMPRWPPGSTGRPTGSSPITRPVAAWPSASRPPRARPARLPPAQGARLDPGRPAHLLPGSQCLAGRGAGRLAASSAPRPAAAHPRRLRPARRHPRQVLPRPRRQVLPRPAPPYTPSTTPIPKWSISASEQAVRSLAASASSSRLR